jgi:hypothetical protein
MIGCAELLGDLLLAVGPQHGHQRRRERHRAPRPVSLRLGDLQPTAHAAERAAHRQRCFL